VVLLGQKAISGNSRMVVGFHGGCSSVDCRNFKGILEEFFLRKDFLYLQLEDQCSLRENPSLPCVKIFAVRFLSGARQRGYLPCVFSIAHGEKKRSAKKIICRALSLNTRQRNSLPCVFFLAHDKQFFYPPGVSLIRNR
jgi:hypothetical protein